MSTAQTTSFVANNTIQIRFELGAVIDSAQTTDIPPGTPDPDHGYIWDNGWVGRVGGDGRYFQGFDTLNPSAIGDLFETTEIGGRETAEIDALSNWTVTVNGQQVGITGFSRKSNILDSAEIGWFIFEFRTLQNVFLELDTELQEGDDIRISFDDPDFEPIEASFEPNTTISEAVHVNLTGFDPDDMVKVAFLSSWNGIDPVTGQSAPQSYEPGSAFEVINATTGAVAFSGAIELAQAIDETTGFSLNYQGTDLYSMDFSDLTDAGSYYVAVDGVGISQTFEIEDQHWEELFEISFSGFYHQRSGIALEEEYTDFVRPASLTTGPDGITVQETTLRITDTSEGYDSALDDPFGQFEGTTTGAVIEDAWGGWHDAGDWDRRTQHLEAARKLIELVELQTDWAEGAAGRIPEGDNGIPDLLDEAIWGMEVFRRMQTEDGGIRGGIESASNPQYGDGSWGESQEVYAYAPDPWSSWEYAAAAAKLANSLDAYDPDAAAEWLDSAIAAMNWANNNIPDGDGFDPQHQNSQNLAAAELFNATGDAQWNTLFLATSSYADGPTTDSYLNEQYEAAFVYARTNQPGADAEVQANAVAALELIADQILTVGGASGFGYQTNAYAPYGWGNTAQQPDSSADVFLRLHALTGDTSWLEIVEADLQYTLGANPLNMVYMTGIDDVRSPEEILNADADTLGYAPPPGITLYGDYNIADYGYNFYHGIMEGDVYPNFDIVPVSESFNGFSIFVPSTEYTVQQGITDMTFVTGYLAAIQAALPQGPLEGSSGADTIDGTARDDVIRGLDGADTLRGMAGDDIIVGAAGDDKLVGKSGNDRLRGGDDNDKIYGGAGDDRLQGNAGEDRMQGGSGADRMTGGAGDDRLIGGGGADTFVFTDGSDYDRVADYEQGRDRVVLNMDALADLTANQVIETYGTLSGNGQRLTLDFGNGDILRLSADAPLDLDIIASDMLLIA